VTAGSVTMDINPPRKRRQNEPVAGPARRRSRVRYRVIFQQLEPEIRRSLRLAVPAAKRSRGAEFPDEKAA